MGQSGRLRVRHDRWILAAYVAFGCVAMWPVVLNIVQGVLGGTDTFTSAWALWWMKECVLNLRNPWYTTWQFAPDGVYLSYYALAPIIGVVWMPVTLALGPAQAVNVLSAVLPMTGAYAAYRLALLLGFTRPVAFAVGGFFGFAPITLGRASVHVMLAAGMVLMPVALATSIQLYRRWRTRDAVALGAVLGAAVLVDLSIAPLVGALVLSHWLGVAIVDRRFPTAGAIRLALVSLVVLSVMIAPQIYFNAVASRTHGYEANPALLAGSYRVFGTDVLAIVRPSPSIRVPAEAAAYLNSIFSHNLDAPATTGIVVFLLGTIGLVTCWRRRLARWAGAVWLIAFLLALGPRIAIGEHPTTAEHHRLQGITPLPMMVHGQELSAVLPYSWLVRLPGLQDFRVAQRFAMLAALPATLLAGLGLQWLLARRSRVARWTVVPLLAVALLEMAPPAPDIDDRIPIKRRRVFGPIRRDPSRSIVVDVPFGWVTSIVSVGVGYRTEPILRAVEHGHPIAYGFTNRLSYSRFEELAAHPFYAGLLLRQRVPSAPPWLTPNPPRAPTIEEARDDVIALNVGWVVLYPDADRSVVPYLNQTGFRWSHAADGFDVYRVRKRPRAAEAEAGSKTVRPPP